jgi:hypothetical protein
MFAYLHRGARPRTAASLPGVGLRRLAAVAGTATAGLLASAATIPAAFAREVPPAAGSYARRSVTPAHHTVHTISATGLAVWQVALIAVCAALITAIVSVTLDRAGTGRSALPSPAARSARPVQMTVRSPI